MRIFLANSPAKTKNARVVSVEYRLALASIPLVLQSAAQVQEAGFARHSYNEHMIWAKWRRYFRSSFTRCWMIALR